MSDVTTIEDVLLRQTAFSVEQMAPGGIDRADPARLGRDDLDRALQRLDELLARPPGSGNPSPRTLREIKERTERLERAFEDGGRRPLVYVDLVVWRLEARLRSAALEVDFTFGDKDGRVSTEDLRLARLHYGAVRGPVGWNRLLLADELERKLFPERTLPSASGLKVPTQDWLHGGGEPLERLGKMARYVDDAALARTYADIAARLAVSDTGDGRSDTLQRALSLLGAEIRQRDGIRPTVTDIARVGCEDPDIKAKLSTPIEMSRKLSPARLLDPYL